MATPTWDAPGTGSGAVAGHITQFLGTHAVAFTYTSGMLTLISEDAGARTTTFTYNSDGTPSTIAAATGSFTGTTRTFNYASGVLTSLT